MSGSHDTESRLAELEDEREQHIRAIELAEQLADECPEIFRWGDGEGGYILHLIREALIKRGLYDFPRHEDLKPKRRPIPTNKRIQIYKRDGFACVYCGSEGDLQIDHIHPVSKGGGNETGNLQTLCRTCNVKKGDR